MEFPTGSTILQEWRFGNCKNKGNEDYFGYYKWKEVANLYIDLQEKYPKRFMLLKYEDAVMRSQETFSKIFNFLNLPFGQITRNFIDESTATHEDSYYAVYKDKRVAHKWRTELDEYIIGEIHADLLNTRLEDFLL